MIRTPKFHWSCDNTRSSGEFVCSWKWPVQSFKFVFQPFTQTEWKDTFFGKWSRFLVRPNFQDLFAADISLYFLTAFSSNSVWNHTLFNCGSSTVVLVWILDFHAFQRFCFILHVTFTTSSWLEPLYCSWRSANWNVQKTKSKILKHPWVCSLLGCVNTDDPQEGHCVSVFSLWSCTHINYPLNKYGIRVFCKICITDYRFCCVCRPTERKISNPSESKSLPSHSLPPHPPLPTPSPLVLLLCSSSLPFLLLLLVVVLRAEELLLVFSFPEPWLDIEPSSSLGNRLQYPWQQRKARKWGGGRPCESHFVHKEGITS